METRKAEKKQEIQFSIRVPEELDEKIKKSAAENKRSKSGEVVMVLEKHFESKEQKSN